MSKIGLTKASFTIQGRSLDNKRELKVVRGETLYYKGHKLGIYRKDCTTDRRRKYDYVLVDIATGLAIAIRARKVYLIEDMEQDKGEYLQRYEDLVKSDFYDKQVKEFSKMKQQEDFK